MNAGSRRAAVAAALVALVCVPPSALAGWSDGQRICDYCRMIFPEEPRTSSRMETTDRQVFEFDAIECLAAFSMRPTIQHSGARAIRVSWYDRPDSLLDARKAFFVVSEKRRSPMSVNLSAYPTKAAARAVAGSQSKPLDWNQVVALVRAKWFDPR